MSLVFIEIPVRHPKLYGLHGLIFIFVDFKVTKVGIAFDFATINGQLSNNSDINFLLLVLLSDRHDVHFLPLIRLLDSIRSYQSIDGICRLSILM